MNKNFWVNFIFCIATCVIAVYAIRSFNVSTSTSDKVTESLNKMQRELSLMNEPYAKVIDVNWKGDLTNVTCKNPPMGLQVIFMNISRNAIQVQEEPKFTLYFGETKIAESPQEEYTIILAPGGILERNVYGEPIQKQLSIEKPDSRLSLNFVFEVKYSRINDKRMMQYSTKRRIDFDCSNLTYYMPMKVIYEKIEQIDEPSS